MFGHFFFKTVGVPFWVPLWSFDQVIIATMQMDSRLSQAPDFVRNKTKRLASKTRTPARWVQIAHHMFLSSWRSMRVLVDAPAAVRRPRPWWETTRWQRVPRAHGVPVQLDSDTWCHGGLSDKLTRSGRWLEKLSMMAVEFTYINISMCVCVILWSYMYISIINVSSIWISYHYISYIYIYIHMSLCHINASWSKSPNIIETQAFNSDCYVWMSWSDSFSLVLPRLVALWLPFSARPEMQVCSRSLWKCRRTVFVIAWSSGHWDMELATAHILHTETIITPCCNALVNVKKCSCCPGFSRIGWELVKTKLTWLHGTVQFNCIIVRIASVDWKPFYHSDCMWLLVDDNSDV